MKLYTLCFLVYNWLGRHPVLATITIGTIGVGTLIAYKQIRLAIERNRIKGNCNGEVLDLMIFNELCECWAQKKTEACGKENCMHSNIRNVIKFIDEAKYTIDFAMYIFTVVDIMDALIAAVKRGVNIRIITDEEMLGSTGAKLLYLKEETMIDIRVPKLSSVMMHHKFMVIDGHRGVSDICRIFKHSVPEPYRPLVLTGSVNWTMQGFGGNWENCLVTTDNITVSKLEDEFYRLWDVSKSI